MPRGIYNRKPKVRATKIDGIELKAAKNMINQAEERLDYTMQQKATIATNQDYVELVDKQDGQLKHMRINIEHYQRRIMELQEELLQAYKDKITMIQYLNEQVNQEKK